MENILPAYKAVGERRYRETNGLYYEDFEPGDVFEHRPGRTVLDVDNTYFTLLTLNIQPVHFDAAYAAKTEWKKPLVDSTFTLALLTGMSVRTVSAKVVANLGWDKVKATHPVFAGDTLYAESTVLHKRESQEPADPGDRDGSDPRRQSGRQGSDELRANDAHLPSRSLPRRSRQLLIALGRGIRRWTQSRSINPGCRPPSKRLQRSRRAAACLWACSSPNRRRCSQALADRAAAGAVDDLRLYYFEATRIAGDTVLRYELNDRIRPYSMFVTGVDRALIKRGIEDGGRKVVSYVPIELS